jgi:hypothetical protein
VRGYKGKEADRVVTGIEPGVVSLVAEQGGHERQAAEELERWKTRGEERKAVDPRRRWSPWPCSLRGGARWIWNGGRWNRRRRWSPRRDRRSGCARDRPGGSGPHCPRGGLPGEDAGRREFRCACSSSRSGMCWSRGSRSARRDLSRPSQPATDRGRANGIGRLAEHQHALTAPQLDIAESPLRTPGAILPECDEPWHWPLQVCSPFGSIDLLMETEVAQNV